MHLLTLIFGIVFLPQAYALKCYECPTGTGSCSDTVSECPAQNYTCAATRLVTYAGGSVMNVSGKSCLLSATCPMGSLNFGVSKLIISSKCCNTDLCNSQPAPAPTTSVPNGKKCFTCNGNTCNAVLNCEGSEDYCISMSADTTVKGCASKEVCLGLQSSTLTEIIGGKLSCCQGDLCNSVGSTSAGLLLLVAPLIYFIIFS